MNECIETEKDIIVGGLIKVNDKYINWDYFYENKNKLLNLINVDEFII